MSVSARLRQLRLVKGMTQEEVAGQIGVTRQTISSYESGRTKPDVDMLVRLADVYGTDFEEILCGQGRALRSVRRVRAAAAVVAGILTVLTMLSSAFLWSANHFFPIEEGLLCPEGKTILTAHQRLVGAWETTDKLILTGALIGFAAVLVLSAACKRAVPLRAKSLYVGGLAGALLLTGMFFGTIDPVFTRVDYSITPALVIARMLFFFAADLMVGLVQRRSRRHRSPSSGERSV